MHVYFFITCVIFCFCKNRDENIQIKKKSIYFFIESIMGNQEKKKE